MKRTALRWSVYLMGLILLALGIALSIKSDLGTSPISSVAFCFSQILDVNLGVMNFIIYTVFVAAQYALRGKNSRVIDLLQLAVSLIFSWSLNQIVSMISYDAAAHSFWTNIGLLLAGMVLIGIGVSASLNMKLVPNPGDGIVQAVAEKMNWEQGFAKNVVDISCVCVTGTLSLVFAGKLVGVGIGTVVAMVGVGRVVALFNRLVMKKLCIAAGV